MDKLQFHPDIYYEVQDAYSWYEQLATGLGDDFIFELEKAYTSIVALPEAWPKFSNRTRRFLLARFPYAIIYNFSNSVCLVVAVMHQSRKPNYWEARVRKND